MCFSLLTNCSPGHVVILDTVGSLLMLLRSNSRKAYRMFFQDALQAIQGETQRPSDSVNVNNTSSST